MAYFLLISHSVASQQIMTKQSLSTQQVLATTISQQQVRFMRLVEMSAPELEDAVHKELEENPALEAVEQQETPKEGNYPYSPRRVVKQYDFYEPGEQKPSLADTLDRQISTRNLDEEVARIARLIIGNLDANGYLSRSLNQIANDVYLADGADPSAQTMNEALHVVQSLDPPGVGARNMQECLELQCRRLLEVLPENSKERGNVELALKIITEHLDLLALHHYQILARRLGVAENLVMKGVQIIKRLNPKPGAPFGEEPEQWNYVIPDFIIKITDDSDISISLNNALPELAINRTFDQAVEEMQKNRKERAKAPKESEFIIDRYRSARDFIKIISRRQETLFNVMTAIAALQRDYLLTEDESLLRPMGLKDVAKATGYDLSLISRSTSNKHVALPWGIFPLRFFFSETFAGKDGKETVSGRSVENAIKLLIDNEDSHHPLSDDAITKRLNAKGLDVSRRTVNKYRDRLGIPPARLRRK